MRKPVLLSLIALILSSMVAAQTIGEWNIYSAYHNAEKSVAVDNRIFVLSDGSLYSYNSDDQELLTYNKENILSDNSIAFIDYCSAQKQLLIVYDNANIDLMDSNENVYNITDFKNRTTIDKTINSVKIEGNEAYIATNFGVVVLDIKKREFSKTFTLNSVVRCCYSHNDSIFACTSDGIFTGNTKKNLADAANWTKISKYIFHDIAVFDNKLIVLGKYDGIYSLNTLTGKVSVLLAGKYNFITVKGENMLAANADEMVLFTSSTEYKKYALNGKSNHIANINNNFWSSEGASGLNCYKIQDDKLVQTVSSVLPNSPRRNYCDYMTFAGDNRLLIAGGCLNYFDLTFYDGTLMVYEDEKWSEFDEDSIASETGEAYVNMTSIVQDPKDSEHHFASSFGHGLYEFKNRKMVNHYTYNNSIIETVVADEKYAPRYVRVSRLCYDPDGNLWMTNTGTKNIFKVLKTDGTWTSLYYSEIASLPTVVEMLFDANDCLWVTSMRFPPALFCIDTKGTYLDTSDDTKKIISTTFTNQDGEKKNINEIYCMVQDKEGTIWLGTDQGLFTLYNPENFFSNNYTFTQVKIPRNDGTNYADYLLDGVYISSMCVDGANRKWIGTQSNGIYLISANGQETLHHFTVDNSPLISNNIVSIVTHPENNEVFIGTDAGLVSFRSDATESMPELKESNVKVFPNPVKPDFTGLVSITGLSFDSRVKIVDSAGKLISEGVSNGGMFAWDRKDHNGRDVTSGVYYVLTADTDEKEGIAAKILVVK